MRNNDAGSKIGTPKQNERDQRKVQARAFALSGLSEQTAEEKIIEICVRQAQIKSYCTNNKHLNFKLSVLQVPETTQPCRFQTNNQ